MGGQVKLALGTRISDLFGSAVASTLEEQFSLATATGGGVDFEQHLADTDSWLDVHAFPSPEGLSVFFRDISGARRIREEIAYLAHHDPLTGLANRLLVHEQLQKSVADGATSATLFIDLDHFKEVNDSLGHPVGDALLRHVADRLRSCVRGSDVVGRLGGDEFAVIQFGVVGGPEAAVLAQHILRELCAPYSIDNETLQIGASIGIALAPSHGGDPDQIFKKADIRILPRQV
jgi:diguanylate cyclase (GGDEF)-like protein